MRAHCLYRALSVALLSLAPALPSPAAAQQGQRMGDLGPYLMPDRAEEIALARTAAPAAVSDQATVLVFGEAGHETAVEGENGFVCLVMRSWGGPAVVNGKPFPDFWNPKVRAPICFNPQAVETALPVYLRKTELALGGADFETLLAAVDRGFGDGSLVVPGPSTMAYMMSSRQYLGDGVQHFRPHLMLYTPYAATRDWSGGARVSDVFVGSDEASPQAIVIVPLPRWSDGSPAAGH